MSLLIEKYSNIIFTAGDINKKIHKAEEKAAGIKSKSEEDIPVRIANLEGLLKRIDDYILKVQALQLLAEKNLESKNVLTIEAPPGYRVNLNRLKNWSMLIDPTASNDPYAQRVYVVAKCDEHFLKKKQTEYLNKLNKLKDDDSSDCLQCIEILKKEIDDLNEQLFQYANSAEVLEFCQLVKTENSRYWYNKTPTKYENIATDSNVFAPGAYAAPLPFGGRALESFPKRLGRLFDLKSGRVLLPVEISLEKEFVITISCAPSKDKSLDKGVQNLILSIIDNSAAGMQKVYLLDGVRYNTSALASLKKIENTFALEKVPRNQEQLTATLEKIVSSFADIDDVLEDCDSVKEFNKKVGYDKRIPLTTIILYGWPKAYDGRNKELISRIMSNYERYGVSFITVTYKKYEPLDKEVEDDLLPEYAMHNAIHIRMFPNDTTISRPDEAPQKFTWYIFEDDLSDEYTKALKAFTIKDTSIGTEFVKRYSLSDIPTYTRGKKSIVLPFGVDGKDNVHSISFDNENFASYLMGASGSGKSTLLHTLITGIIRNYHPDDVELWLADFKMSEFAQYMNPLPPHVKYILLDESQELVYDLLDKLTEKMMERQRFFMKHRDMKKVENVPTDIHMPIIFVILDEFSIMSQAVSESEIYKLRLQNLLAKGRALGIKFIFSSQTFIKGIAGLTQTAKDQIQSRIAMKNSYNEINETLELTSSIRTEQVKTWMEALPPHFALLKYRDGDSLKVKRVQVMYFKGKGDEALEPQRNMIYALKNSMKAVPLEAYDPSTISCYVDKKPVIVDGNSYKAFQYDEIQKQITLYRESNKDDIANDDVIITFGSPRKMTLTKYAVISNESRENILLVARSAEIACGMSIVTTAMKSFTMQGGNVQVWVYSKNRMYRTYKESGFESYNVFEGMNEICNAISEVKDKIMRKEGGNSLIVLLGMEQICNDFELVDNNGTSTLRITNYNSKQLEATSEESIAIADATINSKKDFEDQYNWEELEEKMLDDGKGIEEISEEYNKLYQDFLLKKGIDLPFKTMDTHSDKPQAKTENRPPERTAYNALEDFKYVVKQGSRFGYHFMLYLSNLSDIKATKLQQDLFRHKLVFQVSGEDSLTLFASKIASKLPEHICQYSDTLEQYSLRPYIHKGINWDGWDIDTNGEATNSIIS